MATYRIGNQVYDADSAELQRLLPQVHATRAARSAAAGTRALRCTSQGERQVHRQAHARLGRRPHTHLRLLRAAAELSVSAR